MSDLLGEALARADEAPHYDLGWQVDPDTAETIVAAARNWHTLTTTVQGAIRLSKLVHDLQDEHGLKTRHDIGLRLVDALTVTADPDNA